MIYERRKLLVGATAGFLMAVIIISGIVWTGFLPVVQAEGLLVVKIKDVPAPLRELWLNITEVRVHREGEGNRTWYNVSVVATKPFDLLALRDVSAVLAVGQLEAGTYTEIRFLIAEASANITGKETLQPLTITAPWVKVKFIPNFKIEESLLTTVRIDVEINENPILNNAKLMPVSIANATVIYSQA